MKPAATKLFLSYAKEDERAGLEIASWFGEQGFEVLHWRDPLRRSGRFIERIEQDILQADAFLALISPHFLTSSWCRWERELASLREMHLRVNDPDRVFIHVLQIARTEYPATGPLRIYDWLNLTDEETRSRELSALTGTLRMSDEAPREGPQAMIPGQPSPLFRNRRDELEKLRGLTVAGGALFWLVIAPPELGKSWLLERLSAEVAPPEHSDSAAESSRWIARLVDLREQPLEMRSDVARLLAALFGLTTPVDDAPGVLRAILQEIWRGGRSYLALLDSAELLEKQTARALRSHLSQIHHSLAEDTSDLRLAFVVASRREDEWRGVVPDPRFSMLSLTEFKEDVVRQALYDLAQEMHRNFGHAVLHQNAARVHSLSEGLPALLAGCLQWIQSEEWQGLDRLDTQELFERLARPYIKDRLLSLDSLFPWGGRDLDLQREALEETFRALAPYRLFTQAHLRRHLESSPALAEALDRLGWTIEDLDKAISDTAPLARPLNEPWQEIHPAIRRLLHRYYYKSDEQRASAHLEARKFVEVWADKQVGKEQVIGLVECLWHEAAALRITRPADTEAALSQTARKLSTNLTPSPAYTPEELRAYAAEVMRNDEELQEALRHLPGLLLDRLIDIVMRPAGVTA